MDNNDFILTAEGLHKSFGKNSARVHVLRGLDISVRRGEFLAVMGPSGCGKSTLLHVLGLMTQPDDGKIFFDGSEVNSVSAGNELRRSRIGFVFQRFNLLNVLSAIDNVNISLQVRGCKENGRIDELFEKLSVSHVAKRKPTKMSIGEQQRVAVVRALAHSPSLVLADEPTGNLDSENSAALLGLLKQINRQEKQTIVMITHSPEAAGYADRIVRMKDGKIIDNSEN